MTTWQRWKRGMGMCVLLGFSGLASFLMAGIASYVLVILPAEWITGSSAIEANLNEIIAALMVIMTPLFVDIAYEAQKHASISK